MQPGWGLFICLAHNTEKLNSLNENPSFSRQHTHTHTHIHTQTVLSLYFLSSGYLSHHLLGFVVVPLFFPLLFSISHIYNVHHAHTYTLCPLFSPAVCGGCGRGRMPAGRAGGGEQPVAWRSRRVCRPAAAVTARWVSSRDLHTSE